MPQLTFELWMVSVPLITYQRSPKTHREHISEQVDWEQIGSARANQ